MNIGDQKEFSVRIRYRQPLQKGTLTRLEDGFYILFNKKQRGIAPGQFAALYIEDELVGSGIISH
ncbi:tRNA-specific 2-thiouridylase MnmA [compost metagenome]